MRVLLTTRRDTGAWPLVTVAVAVLALVFGLPQEESMLWRIVIGAGCVLGIYWALVVLVNRYRVILDDGVVTVSYTPLPWPHSCPSVAADQVARVFPAEQVPAGAADKPSRCTLRLRLVDGTDVELLAVASTALGWSLAERLAAAWPEPGIELPEP